MTTVTVNNKANSASANPPGYNVWVGGKERGDVENGAVKIPKGAKVTLPITPKVLCNGKLLTWYYDYAWFSGEAIDGPFYDHQEVLVPGVSDVSESTSSRLRESTSSSLRESTSSRLRESKQKKCQT